ncbi:MAG: class I SAM-dependent RNA methyltransferase, partial [Clostridia bacterium]|nr:class I SAM-dependent RNA methyltransferase [Clostridia bacterium]
MQAFEYVVPVLFGMEAICAKEIRNLGYETTAVEDGRVIFKGDLNATARVNIGLRTGERVLLKLKTFKALSFTELFDKCHAINWE